jgi:curved DNA-binding protein CbpA
VQPTAQTSGRLEAGVLAGILRDLYLGRRNGLLAFSRATVSRGELRRSLRLRSGSVVAASSNVPEEALGPTLLRHGLLEADALARATLRQDRDGSRFGLVLRELGLVDEEHLQELLAAHVREVFGRILDMEDSAWSFAEEPVPRDEDITLRVPTGELIFEAVRRIEDADVARYQLGDIDVPLALARDPQLRSQRLGLRPLDAYLLSKIDGRTTGRQLLDLVPRQREEGLKSLLGLLCTGCAQRADASGVPSPEEGEGRPEAEVPSRREVLEAHRALASRRLHELLEAPVEDDESELRAAYLRHARRFHPDLHQVPALADLRDHLEGVFLRIGQAYEVLRDPDARARYQRGRPVPDAPAGEPEGIEDALLRAHELMVVERAAEAVPLLERVVAFPHGPAMQRARVLLAQARMEEPGGEAEAEELLRSVLEVDPRHVVATYTLASLYRQQGLPGRALAMEQKVRDLLADLGSISGRLHEGALPGLLCRIYLGRKTGVVTFSGGDAVRSFRFRGGHLLNSSSSLSHERLGETLVQRGALALGDLERARAIKQRERRPLGLVLMELALIDEEQLQQGLAAQVRDNLARLFALREARYTVRDEEVPPEFDMTLHTSTGNLILEAARRVEDPAAVRFALGDLGRVLVPASDPLLSLQRISLKPADGYLLSRVDGSNSASAVLELLPMPAEQAERSLLGLLCVGLVEFAASVPRSAPAPLTSRPSSPSDSRAPVQDTASREEVLTVHRHLGLLDDHQVLGLKPGASEAEIKQAYVRLARRFHPDLQHQPALADLRDKLEQIFLRLSRAHEALRATEGRARPVVPAPDPPAASPPRPAPSVAPPPLAPAADPLAQQEEVRRLQELMDAGKLVEAFGPLSVLVETAQGAVRQKARLLLARCHQRNPKALRQAEELLRSVVQDDPQHVEAHLALGGLYKAAGLRGRALTSYRRALELRPGQPEALAEIKALGAIAPGR